MGKRDIRPQMLMTLSGSYPTRAAYESGLFLPSFAQPRALRHYSEYTVPDLDGMASDSTWDEASPCPGADGHSSCEFSDFCNHMYTAEFACDCKIAWKKRAGLALPTSV